MLALDELVLLGAGAVDLLVALKRAGRFFREFLPAQKAQLLFPLATLFLVSASSPVWMDLPLQDEAAILRGGPGAEAIQHAALVRMLVWLRSFLLLGAAVASLVLSYLPTQWAPRRLIRWVLLPSFGGVLLFGLQLLVVTGVRESFFQSRWDILWRALIALPGLVLHARTGFYAALAGIVLLGLAAWRVHHGRTEVPVRFCPSAVPEGEGRADPQGARRIVGFIGFLLAAPVVFSPVMLLVEKIIDRAFPSGLPQNLFHWLYLGTTTFDALLFVFIVACLMGGSWKTEFRRLLNLAHWRDYTVALAVPFVITVVPRLIFYVAVDLAFYFHWEGVRHPVHVALLLLSPPSLWPLAWLPRTLGVEIAWRGYLQTRLTQRFGLRRGLFLIGLLWWWVGVSKFSPPHPSLLPTVLVAEGSALLGGIVFAALLGWIFLRSGSVLPVTLMHVACSVFLVRFGGAWQLDQFRALPWMELVLAALIAYWFFSRYPPRAPEAPPAPNASA